MITFRQMKVCVGGAAALLGVSVLVAACGSSGAANPTSTPSGSASAAATGTTAIAAAARGVAIGTASGSMGTYLTGTGGRAVYLWEADSHAMSNCSGACAQAWPPVTTKSTPIAAGTVTSSRLGTIHRANGSKQVTYDHHPLYYFAGDAGKSTTRGQGSAAFGAKWWLVAPAGAAINSASTPSSPASSAPTGSSSAAGSWG